jgi:hypothetical protein
VGGPNACPAAKEVALVRLLSVEAPRLPMKNCDRPDQCTCRYRHFDDRRQGPRRHVEDTGIRKPWEDKERRRMRGRRDSDFEDHF